MQGIKKNYSRTPLGKVCSCLPYPQRSITEFPRRLGNSYWHPVRWIPALTCEAGDTTAELCITVSTVAALCCHKVSFRQTRLTFHQRKQNCTPTSTKERAFNKARGKRSLSACRHVYIWGTGTELQIKDASVKCHSKKVCCKILYFQ